MYYIDGYTIRYSNTYRVEAADDRPYLHGFHFHLGVFRKEEQMMYLLVIGGFLVFLAIVFLLLYAYCWLLERLFPNFTNEDKYYND